MHQQHLFARVNGFGLSRKGILRAEKGSIGLKPIVFIIILAALLLLFFRPAGPCEKPLTYRIGAVDERFGLSREEFSRLVAKAASVWSVPMSRELFREEPEGKIVISLVYDYRQEASERLKQLNYDIRHTRATYEELKVRFETLKTEFDDKKQRLEEDLGAFNGQVRVFNEENETVRRRGGVSEEDYQRLMREKENLNANQSQLQSRQAELNRTAETLNSMAVVINEIAREHNLGTVTYREEGGKLGDEFQKGQYARKGLKENITVYQFDGEKSLIRVLVHELGHALGLSHNDYPHAVMHRLVPDGASYDLTPADIAALKARCGER